MAAVNPAFNANIEVQFYFENLPSGVLGGATPVYPAVVPSNGLTNHVVAFDNIKNNNDSNAGAKDIVISMQALVSEANWYYGSDPGLIGSAQDDFESTMVHEIIHSIGWLESMDQNGSSGSGNPNAWNTFDQYLGDGTSTFLNTTTFTLDTAAFQANVVEGTGAIPPNGTGLYFHGPQAMAANGGNPPPMYSPTTYSPGSSVSHLDTDFCTSSILVMEHAAASGTTSRTIQPLEFAILQDIFGVPVPEPSTALLLFGGSSLLFIRRRRYS